MKMYFLVEGAVGSQRDTSEYWHASRGRGGAAEDPVKHLEKFQGKVA